MSVFSRKKAQELKTAAEVEDAFQESEMVFETDARAVSLLAEAAAKKLLEEAITHLRELTRWTGPHATGLNMRGAQGAAKKFLTNFDETRH